MQQEPPVTCPRAGRAAHHRAAVAVSLVAVALLASPYGCGGERGEADSGVRSQKRDQNPQPAARRQTVAPSRCPPGLPSCRTTEGRVVYVERVDPDGDGDAHFVIVDPQGITLPGLTAIDVRRGLRPHPLPGLGELISAAGPVQTGSYGQSQIHAIEMQVTASRAAR